MVPPGVAVTGEESAFTCRNNSQTAPEDFLEGFHVLCPPRAGTPRPLAQEDKNRRDLQLEREERLAAELARLNREKLKDAKLRQQVRENSLELRELEKKLKSAYVNKERAAQIAEKAALQYEEMKCERERAQKMKEEYERVIKEESSAELRRNEEKIMYQQELEKQLEEQEKKKQDAYKEFLREKLMIDEIVRKIYEEDQMEKQLKLDKMRATQMYIEEFKKEQAIWRRRKLEEMEEENRKITEFANIQRQREEDRMAKVRETEEKKQRLQSMNLQREQQKREELERLRQELYLEEQAETERQKELVRAGRRCRKQFAFKQTVQQAVRGEEEAFRQQLLAKFAEDDRVEQMNAQKRRMKQLEHRRAVEKFLEDRRKQFIADKVRVFVLTFGLRQKVRGNCREMCRAEAGLGLGVLTRKKSFRAEFVAQEVSQHPSAPVCLTCSASTSSGTEVFTVGLDDLFQPEVVCGPGAVGAAALVMMWEKGKAQPGNKSWAPILQGLDLFLGNASRVS
uniref:Meiosis-specific nuclear structural protein 1 n=1 Tax=Athene cunicularia TaxID=194338 RepID=A0A663LXT7_ATHCN